MRRKIREVKGKEVQEGGIFRHFLLIFPDLGGYMDMHLTQFLESIPKGIIPQEQIEEYSRGEREESREQR